MYSDQCAVMYHSMKSMSVNSKPSIKDCSTKITDTKFTNYYTGEQNFC